MERWESEGEDDREDGSRDVAQKERKESRDLPVLVLANNHVEITAELVTLIRKVSYWHVSPYSAREHTE